MHTVAHPFLATAARWNRGRFDRHEIRSNHTLRAAHWHLRTIADLIGPDTETSSITRADLEVALELLHISPRSANQVRSTLRQFFAWATDVADICRRNPAAGIRNARTDRRRPRRVPARHVTAVLEHADLQGQTMLLIAAHLGLRRSEIAGLRVEDFDPDARTLLVRADTAKGRKERLEPVEGEALRAICDWLRWRARQRPPQGAPLEVVRKVLGHENLSTLSTYTDAQLDELRPWIARADYRPGS